MSKQSGASSRLMTGVSEASTVDGTLEAGPPRRWHDLDALRGFAMLLGIALHVSVSFFPGFWIVNDSKAAKDGWFDEFFHAVHGFRMPLFFLLSGFFTMMLWRRRGTSGLVRHRLRRIAVPLAIFFIPIGVLMTWTVDNAIDAGVTDYIQDNDDIWAAVFLGNHEAVERLLDDGISVNAPNTAEGDDTPLHVAAFADDVEMVEMLLDRGADPNRPAVGGMPIDYAVFVGSTEVAEALVDGGAADPRPSGTDWADIGFWAEGAGAADQIQDELGLDPVGR